MTVVEDIMTRAEGMSLDATGKATKVGSAIRDNHTRKAEDVVD